MTAAAPATIPASHRQPAWKLLNASNQLSASNWTAARETAGLMWEPTVSRILKSDADGMPVLEGMDDDGRPVYAYEEGHKRITRGPGGDKLGIVGESYGVISHAAIGALVDPLLDVPGTSFEHLVELEGGRRVFALIRVGEERQLGADFSPTVPLLAMQTSHDGTGALRLWGTCTRLVCTNQASASEVTARSKGLSATIRHTNRWEFNAQRVSALVEMARSQFDMIASVSAELSDIKITSREREAYVRAMFPMPPVGERTDRAIRAVEKNRLSLQELLESETNEPIAHTALGLAQAAVEWADWQRRYDSLDSLLHRNVIRPQLVKVKAWKLARNVRSLELAA
ncbi:DUF932 domain-containing protein [Streptomyces sp. LHD-70]|uniref:DUF932 domain-containing protein n=1 Tax=Streptomyces sp. LHD-70 TaxID=3072140 RepID=UPI00280CBCAE|nr:DUF932 domain-containing protein [Streptomyces sp. LHD-70]MDQ8704895.1 DUF932 domain-containing protein [Streptomyces sp. LHD-70]